MGQCRRRKLAAATSLIPGLTCLSQNPYQAPPVPYPSRLFKHIAASHTSSEASSTDSEDSSPPREHRAYRVRVGRGGRMLVDRRLSRPPALRWDSDGEDESALAESQERDRRLQEQWRFDTDDEPPAGPEGPEEHARQLVDDYAES